MDCKSIEGKLIETGEKLLSPPSSSRDLLSLLDEAEKLLASIDLFPSSTVISALQPIKAALAAKRILSHSNNDVRVSVTLCICEISRIIAPEDPCDGIDRMKEFFMRIVESFAKLDDFNSRSFYKRVSILETVAKIKSCVLMIDLDCDDLILDMFNQFLNRISLEHEANISFYMETIMSLVLKESDEISKDLVSCLLQSVKERRMVNKAVSFRLGEKVIRNCADKLKPMLKELVGNKAKEYSEVVAYICQDASGIMEQKKSTKEVDQEPEEAERPQKAGPLSQNGDINLDILLKDVVSSKRSLKKYGRKANVDGLRRLKRKRGPESETDRDKGDKINDKASRRKRHLKLGENIVGKRILVWWPLDKTFYNGAVVGYNHSDKKHTVIYDDGDSEVLILKDEVWNYLEEAIEHTVVLEMGWGKKKRRTSSRKEKKETPMRSKRIANSKAKKLAETPKTETVSKKDSESKECGSKITLKLKLNEPTEKASGAVGAKSSSNCLYTGTNLQ